MKLTTALLFIIICSSCEENVIQGNSSNSDQKQNIKIIDESFTLLDSVAKPDELITNNTSENDEPAIEVKDRVEEIEITPIIEIIHNYSEYNAFLKSHIASSGKVNYSKIKQNLSQLENILSFIEINQPEENWTRNQKLSYWINSYNAYTLYFVAKEFPVNSILDINAKPWDVKFIPSKNGLISLNDIEHKIIRANFNEPRIHFALNCASQSCPQLLNKAYKPGALNNQLENQTQNFLNDSSKNKLNNVSNIEISSLFDWYKDDFSKEDQNVISFLQKYNSNITSDTKIRFMEYSWELND